MNQSYNVIGIMSGTSLDGVDLAFAEFFKKDTGWSFRLIASETRPYNLFWKKKLAEIMHSTAEDFVLTDVSLGHYIGGLVNQFIKKHHINPQLISSHGHTVFHQPEKKTTVQIGNGAAIAAITGLLTVCDFRVTDVAKGGQGAPLVPIGDQLLFSQYDYCLNLGGIANISFEKNGRRIAFDICPVNMALNYLAEKAGKNYDNKGRMASKGQVNPQLLKELNSLSFYKKNSPKSLGAEWFNRYFKQFLDRDGISLNDKQATMVEHICFQINKVLSNGGAKNTHKMLITGGGAFHEFLIGKIQSKLRVNSIIPDKNLINFKEALVFGLLGVLRLRNEPNTLSSVTGAKGNSSSGGIYNP